MPSTCSLKEQPPEPIIKGGSDFDDEDGFSTSHVDGDGVEMMDAQKEAARERNARFAREETRAVSCLRVLVYFIILLTAVMVSGGVYIYASNDEQEAFEDTFSIHASKVIETFSDSVERKLGAMGTMANTITSYADASGSTFPFVTVPNFAVHGADLRVQADALVFHWAPLVTEEARLMWEEYAFMNRFHINDAFAMDSELREEQDNFFGLGNSEDHQEDNEQKEQGGRRYLAQEENAENPDPNILHDGTGYHLRIYQSEGNQTVEPEGNGLYLPLWQRSPINAAKQMMLNLNFATAPSFRGVLPQLMKDLKVVINRVFIPLEHAQKQFNSNLVIGQYRHDSQQYSEDPISIFAYPVFDSFNQTEKQLGGVLISFLYWRVIFQDILPPRAKGIICVLENSYNQTYSYQLDGPDATFLGEGDPHSPKYDRMAVSQDVTAYVNRRAGPETRAYTTVPLHDSYGIYKLYVYPSQETEDGYMSNKPLVYTIVVASVFLLTALVFGMFNYLVERRQRIVMTRAIQSGAIVSSLFPEKVQNRLYEAPNKKSEQTATGAWKVGGNKEDGLNGVGTNIGSSAGSQIADLYPETTIMFADLAGFTAWSASRTPCEVFDLLELLYGAFDSIALKRSVFKVETIGDCYLACCGLPEPNPDHAVVMVKFARDCMLKMNELVKKASDRLGEDTMVLQFRVGLHSGPVTAGVLRGQKSRFQLFGDSVNTASRMESLGVPGRIQVSQSTADELRAKGKGMWLQAREDKIVAKGKGELQTYWVTTFQADQSAVSRISSRALLCDPGAINRSSCHRSIGQLTESEDEASTNSLEGMRDLVDV